jgi:hypothetical protein
MLYWQFNIVRVLSNLIYQHRTKRSISPNIYVFIISENRHYILLILMHQEKNTYESAETGRTYQTKLCEINKKRKGNVMMTNCHVLQASIPTSLQRFRTSSPTLRDQWSLLTPIQCNAHMCRRLFTRQGGSWFSWSLLDLIWFLLFYRLWWKWWVVCLFEPSDAFTKNSTLEVLNPRMAGDSSYQCPSSQLCFQKEKMCQSFFLEKLWWWIKKKFTLNSQQPNFLQ